MMPLVTPASAGVLAAEALASSAMAVTAATSRTVLVAPRRSLIARESTIRVAPRPQRLPLAS